MAKNILASGFKEHNPQKQAIENKLKQIIDKNYKKNAYIYIETPAVELNSVLTSKWWNEVSKQIFWLYWLAQAGDDLKDYSLHFDLTIPFARYVVEHENDIKFPFKRYQIAKVWRWERPQKCRYREFMQCDIDIVDTNLNINYDVEVIEVLYKTIIEILDFLDIKENVEVHINNKHIINTICDMYKLSSENRTVFLKLLDDYYKLTKEKYISTLVEIFGEKTDEIIKILSTDLSDFKFDNENNWVSDLLYIYNSLKEAWVNVVFDPYITRWLDYYTWVVFETFIVRDEKIALSVCSGGRYDDLVSSVVKLADSKIWQLNGVWGSIWLSRLFCVLDNMGLINKNISDADIMIFNLWASVNYLKKIKWNLVNTNRSVDLYYNQAKLDKQFKYAENKNIVYGIFAWENEENNSNIIIKNLLERTEETIKIEDLETYFCTKK